MNAQRDMSHLIKPDDVHTLPGLFRERVRRSPDKTAYQFFDFTSGSWRSTTWAEMSNDVARYQAALQAEQLQPGDKIAIMLPNCREWITMEQAALGLGLVVVPLYINDRPDNVAFILQDAGVKLLLIKGQERFAQLDPIRAQLDGLVRLLSLEQCENTNGFSRYKSIQEWLPESAVGLSERVLDGGELATIVYTSGTTGRPKGVMLSHKNILSNAYAGIHCVPVFPEDLFLSFLPLSHMLERSLGYYIPMMAGATVAFARSVPDLPDDLLAIKPTVLISVPRIYEKVYIKLEEQIENKSALARSLFRKAVDTGWKRFELRQKRGAWKTSFLLWPLLERLVAKKVMDRLGGRLRVAICGGAPLSFKVARTFIGLGLELIQGYGLTEASPIIAGNRAHSNDPKSVGLPMLGTDVKVDDSGELLAKGNGVMLGYWHNPAATKEVIDVEGWLHTGDKAEIVDNHIYITGRVKEIIVLSNGEKIPPSDMEMAISLDPLFEQVLVVGEGRPYLSAFIVLNQEHFQEVADQLQLAKDESALNAKQLHKFVLERVRKQIREFPGYAQIHRVALFLEPFSIENGFMTPTLKLRRDRILQNFADKVESLYQGH
jgi:long-chain acyl-CoA synthetase